MYEDTIYEDNVLMYNDEDCLRNDHVKKKRSLDALVEQAEIRL